MVSYPNIPQPRPEPPAHPRAKRRRKAGESLDVTLPEAEEMVTRWAPAESAYRGYQVEPNIKEFELGYLVWWSEPALPAGVPPRPGDAATSMVIDRATGEMRAFSYQPQFSLTDQYRQMQQLAAQDRANTSWWKRLLR